MCVIKDNVIHKIFNLIDKKKAICDGTYEEHSIYEENIEKTRENLMHNLINIIEQKNFKSTIYVDKQI